MSTSGERTIVIATRNAGKVNEFRQLLAPLGCTVQSLADYPQIPEIVEDGQTFLANAEIKARTVAGALSVPVIADDSGLAVERLGGRPGIYSARYSGEGATDESNNLKLLQELRELSKDDPGAGAAADGEPRLLSAAQFICAIVFYNPLPHAAPIIMRNEGVVNGYIIDQARGRHGFGYDPLFYLPTLQRTMAELDGNEKNAISHRGQAIQQLLEQLKTRYFT